MDIVQKVKEIGSQKDLVKETRMMTDTSCPFNIDIFNFDFAYIDEHRGIDPLLSGYSEIDEDEDEVKDFISNANALAAKRNAQDNVQKHGLSYQEYDEIQFYSYYGYGVELDNQSAGNFQSMAVSMERCIGQEYAEEVAASYDSVLDLVLDLKFAKAMEDIFGSADAMVNWDSLMAPKTLQRLKDEYGISLTKTGNYYSLALVDEDGNVIKDENGNLAQHLTTDRFIPDGLSQSNERWIGLFLDAMGYDCVSMLDYSPEEWDLIEQAALLDNKYLGSARVEANQEIVKNGSQAQKYVREQHNLLGPDGKLALKDDDYSAWLNGEYVDPQGNKTGRRAYWKQFEYDRAQGNFNNRTITLGYGDNAVSFQIGWSNKSIGRNIYAVYEETGELKTSASAVRGGSVHGSGHSSYGSNVGASESEFDNETYVDKQEKDNDEKLTLGEFKELITEYMEDGLTKSEAILAIKSKYDIADEFVEVLNI